jgi:CubicO group peptidase (beta-lactamase class C family)
VAGHEAKLVSWQTGPVPTDTSRFAQIDAIAANFASAGGQPGLAYGIVADGELVHAAGLGEHVLSGPVPDADTVFRIASMSKSFTASAILILRDEGAFTLDDPAAEYVPELRGWPLVTPDADVVSIRHLLTMTAGFPTDDPWGDRQQGLPLDHFGKLLAGGVSFVWAPGTRFEYSNLGYAILGRVISEVTETPYHEVIRERLLRPLGMTSTGFEAEEFSPAGELGPAALASGYRRTDAGWQELPFDPYGAFAPMGGIFSTVRDLARWVAGFAAAFPPGTQAAAGHPLSRASRREMQFQHVLTAGGKFGVSSYGYGLFVDEDARWGRVVSHSGGYPGFGSNMRWHPASGTGVIALGNSTYAQVTGLAGRLLDAALRDRPRAAVPLAPAQLPWPETLAAQETANGLLRDWDDATADALFAGNVALDAPYAERRHAIELIRDRIGDFTEDPGRNPESDTPAHRRWWLTGERGTVQAQIQLSPQRPPLVQSLTIAVPPAADSVLLRAIAALVTWMNDGGRDWPAELPVTPGTEVAPLARRLRMAAVGAGRCRVGGWRAGDGVSTATVELAGDEATLHLAVTVDPLTSAVRQVGITGIPQP